MNLFVETREMVRDAARKLFKSTTMRKVAAHALFVVIMAGVLFSGFYRGEEQLRVGQISPKDIRSPVTRVVVDEQRTQELKQLAASRVQKVYKEDREARPRAQQDLEAFLTSVTQARSAAGLSASAREKELQALLTAVVQARELKGVDVAAVARYLVSASDEDLAEMSRHATSILGQLMESPVTEEALGGSFEQAAARSAGLGLAPEAEQFVWLAVVHSLRPNMVYDAEATQAAIDDAVSKVVPVQITIRQNQVIVRAGDPITAEHVSILEQLG
ncbi:MAG: phosphohydrolase, partial [Syntrophomonadaceae bacterium]|nr:phosphohydrolase [Syntrophomonadaceae bacterium]